MNKPLAKRGGRSHYLSRAELGKLGPDGISEMARNIKDQNDLYVIQGFCDVELIEEIRCYLHQIGTHSLPSYHPTEEGCPDFHRVVDNDQRSYVRGVFHQYLFHPWNQNLFDLHNRFRDLYHLKNQVSGLDRGRFLDSPYTHFVPRIAFHHYPAGGGYLTPHADPVGEHQIAIPTLQMTKKGKDFTSGGLFYVDNQGSKQCVDELSECGDVVLFNAETVHGVDPIDPEESRIRWHEPRGRWMLLATMIRTASNASVPSSVEVENI